MHCRICNNEKDNHIYEPREMMFGYKDVFRYVECSSCDCLQIEKFPSDMSRYYPENYYSYKSISDSHHVKNFIIKLRNKYALLNRGLIGKLFHSRYPNLSLKCISKIPLRKNSNILDVGCGTGSLIYSLHEFGFKNLLGIDTFNKEDIEYDNGLKVLRKMIHEIDGKWDLIMFHHSFEHILDPLETLQKVFMLLRSDGICVIRIPTVSSYAWRHYGLNWVQLDAPRHFFLHSIKSIRILADKAGLELYKIVYDSTSFQFWGSEQYKMDIPLLDKRSYLENPRKSIFSKAEIRFFTKFAEKLNNVKQGDQAIFFLRIKQCKRI